MQIIQCHKKSVAGRWLLVARKCFLRFRCCFFTSNKQLTASNERGFTLIEIVLGIAIIGVVAGLLAPIIINASKAYAVVVNQKKALAQLRFVMERIESEVRLIPDTNSIDIWTGNQIQFDIPSESNINYQLNGTDLLRNGSVIADDVASINFFYLKSDGSNASLKSDINRIGLELVINAGDYGFIKARSVVYPRRFSSAYAGFQ